MNVENPLNIPVALEPIETKPGKKKTRRFLISENDFTRRTCFKYMLVNQFKLSKEQDIVFIDDGKEALNELKLSIKGEMKQRQRVKENRANQVEKEWLFDAIMLDYEMPTLSGLAIIRKVKDKFTKKNLPMPRVLLLASI